MGAHHGHHHHGHHGHCHSHGSEGNILIAFLLNLGFAILELIGGLYTNSVSILSDALHDMGDSLSLALAWYLERYAGRGRDRHFSYGYKRFSLLSALVISLILLVGSFFVISSAVERIITPAEPKAEGMLLLALIGLAVNGYAAYRMSRGSSLSDRAVRLHLMEDVLGWAAVLVVSIVMLFVNLPILDPLLSLGITGWILYNVYHNLRDNFRILLQGVPEGVDTERLEQALRAIPAILGTHDLHIWTLNGEEHIGSIHLTYDSKLYSLASDIAQLKREVRAVALEHQIHHLTIELDPQGESCGCAHCDETPDEHMHEGETSCCDQDH